MLFPCVDGGNERFNCYLKDKSTNSHGPERSVENKCHQEEVPEKGNNREIFPETNKYEKWKSLILYDPLRTIYKKNRYT